MRRFAFLALLAIFLALPAVAGDCPALPCTCTTSIPGCCTPCKDNMGMDGPIVNAEALSVDPNLDGPIEGHPGAYGSTGTKPPAGEFLAGFDFHYQDQSSPGVTFGWQHKKTGILVTAGVAAMRYDSRTWEVPILIDCKTVLAPFTEGGHTMAAYSVGVLFPLRTLARPAR